MKRRTLDDGIAHAVSNEQPMIHDGTERSTGQGEQQSLSYGH